MLNATLRVRFLTSEVKAVGLSACMYDIVIVVVCVRGRGEGPT